MNNNYKISMLWEAWGTEPNAFQDKVLLKIKFGKLIHSGPVSFPTEVWWEILALRNWDLRPSPSSVYFQLSIRVQVTWLLATFPGLPFPICEMVIH